MGGVKCGAKGRVDESPPVGCAMVINAASKIYKCNIFHPSGAVIRALSPVAVRRVGICDPPHVLGRPGGPGPPAGNTDTIPLMQVSSGNLPSFHKTGDLKVHCGVTFGMVEIRAAARGRGRARGTSKFTPSIIWREALDTTAERKSAAIVLPCCNSHTPRPSHPP